MSIQPSVLVQVFSSEEVLGVPVVLGQVIGQEEVLGATVVLGLVLTRRKCLVRRRCSEPHNAGLV